MNYMLIIGRESLADEQEYAAVNKYLVTAPRHHKLRASAELVIDRMEDLERAAERAALIETDEAARRVHIERARTWQLAAWAVEKLLSDV